MKLWFHLLCRDIEAQCGFYGALLALPEAVASRSPIYRALEAPGFQFGFNAAPAYALLALEDRRPQAGAGAPPVVAYPTLMLDTPHAVDAAARRATALGGRLRKGPYATYYGQWQAVLEDPEGNVFRVACIGLPDGVERPALPA